MSAVLSVAGLACQLAGILVAVAGLWKTWHEFAPEGESFLRPIVSRASAARRRIAAILGRAIARILRRHPDVRFGAGVALGVPASASARGRMQFRELPADLDTPSALAELDSRTRQLMTKLADATDRHADDLDDARRLHADLEGRLDAIGEQLDERTQRVAIGGIRLEALGLFLVALGTGLQGLALTTGA